MICGGAALVGFAVPLIATPLLKLYNTGVVAGNEIYIISFWLVAWALTVVQGVWMLKHVGDKIIDDMLVTAIICALVLVVVRFIIWIVYEPPSPFTGLDAGGALLLIVVALIAARANRY